MALLKINWNPARRELRQFGSIWLTGFLAIAGAVVLYRTGSVATAIVLWAVAGLMCLIALLYPAAMRPVYIGLTVAAFPIGWTISHLLLAVIFYLVITPIGWLLRL